MRAVLLGVWRVATALAILVSALAIALGRQSRTIVDERRPTAPRLEPIGGYLFPGRGTGLRLLDVETGVVERLRPPGPLRIEHAAISPWRDGRGLRQAAGMWSRRSEQTGETIIGLGRFSLPGWDAVDQFETEQVPAGPVCWFPDTTSRILYAGRDGRLYRFSFDDPGDGPQPVEWRVAPPRGLLLVSDPVWPCVSGPRGRVIVSLTYATEEQETAARRGPARHARLWWLELDRDGSAIVAAGRLISPATVENERPVVEEEMPNISTNLDAGLTLAYLARHRSEAVHRMRLAPVSIDGRGRPHVDGRDVVELPGGRIRARPVFSRDGRRVRALAGAAAGTGRVASVFVADFVSRPRDRMLFSAFPERTRRLPPAS